MGRRQGTVFGKRKAKEPPVPVVDWTDVGEFSISNVVKPRTKSRKRPVLGPRAVRVPNSGSDEPVFAPCAFFNPNPRSPVPPGTEHRLYEDEDAQRLLNSIDVPEEADGERRHQVRDGHGAVIGTIRRIPAKRPFKHTWRIDQPGRPEIVGRNQWATTDPKQLASIGAGKAFFDVLNAVLYTGTEVADQVVRTLTWKAGDEQVMTSEVDSVTIKVDWLDRRLAFAFALLQDR